MMKRLLVVIMVAFAAAANAQFSLSGGPSLLKGFGEPGAFYGLHIGVEIPNDDAMSIYGRVSHHFFKPSEDSITATLTAINTSTTPYSLTARGVQSMNYTIIEGGTRYYLGNGFDYGWAGYGGSKFALIFNKVKTEFDGVDETKYRFDAGGTGDGSILAFAIGLTGGVKYTQAPMGTFYSDIGLSYNIFATKSDASVNESQYSAVLFTLTVGYRRDLGW